MNIIDRHKVAEIAVTIALEQHNTQREMTSRLISDIYGRYVQQDQIATGFNNMLNSLNDLSLDTPDAPMVCSRGEGRREIVGRKGEGRGEGETLGSEGKREGVRDFRYLRTLRPTRPDSNGV